ncbi:MAG: hypothetical protein HON94_05250, partial [Methylococcales bacterium]|nr:hypothetical protein [Methylococcales bacterium]
TSICVQLDEQAERRYPLRLLDRVVVIGLINMPMEVILACSMEGVSVIFLDGNGKPIAYAHGLMIKDISFLLLLNQFIDLVDWQDKYLSWKKSTLIQYEAFFCHSSKNINEIHSSSINFFNGLLFNQINLQLNQVGLMQEMSVFRGSGLAIDVDMVNILLPFTQQLLLKNLSLVKHDNYSTKVIATYFEKNFISINDEINRLLKRLNHFLLSHLY